MGVVILYPNIRGSSGYGKTFLQLDNGFEREGSYKDIGALLDWIATQPDLDAKRVMVTGGSYGGHMTLAVSYLYADKIRCAVNIVGISNLVTFLENTESYRRDLRRAEYGDERDPKMQAVFERISPSNHAAKIKSALLVAHGRNDPRVPFGEAELIASKAQGPVWTVYADNEGHGFAKKENRDYLNAATVMFFREFLLK
jgi:dipeptidyl aminopeptidase/acylaminoacyl peptidase